MPGALDSKALKLVIPIAREVIDASVARDPPLG
jgi:hypothetical protein